MKRRLTIVLALLIGIVTNVLILFQLPVTMPDIVTVKVDMEATQKGEYQFFYSDGVFDLDHCKTRKYEKANTREVLEFDIPTQYSDWRIDFGDEAAVVKIHAIKISYGGRTADVKGQLLNRENELKGIQLLEEKSGYVEIATTKDDPQCIFAFGDTFVRDTVYGLAEKWCSMLNIIVCVAIDLILLGAILLGSRIAELVRELFSNKKLILNLAKNDFKTKYVGSYLGMIWAFIQPTVTVIVYWFVFQVGLRSGGVGDVPFILWLIAGLVPWFFFSDSLGAGTTALLEYQYLVKKIVFKISILPVVKILSAMFVHLFFMLLAVVICAFYGYLPDLYTVQVIYYTFCTFALSLALVYFTCSIVVFFRDTTQLVQVFLQVGIWMTPIMWNVAMLPNKFLWIFKLMPMYYIVMGYRDSLINKVWFWEKIYETVWFWGFTLVLFGVGTLVFKKLKVHFADVL